MGFSRPSTVPLGVRMLRGLLRHYPLNTPRTTLLDHLPDVPVGCGVFHIKHGRRISACYAGADVISKSLFWLGDFDPWVEQALRRLARAGDTVFDVGANIGATVLALAQQVGSAGRVFCFEPFPPHLAKLRENVRCNELANVTINDCALSDVPGRLTMGMPDHDHQGMARVMPGAAVASAEHHEVAADTFDAFCARHAIENVAVCKIDVEGHELSVLHGMRRSLAAGIIQAFVFERQAAGSLARDEVAALLGDHGYRVLRLHKRLVGLDAAECGRDAPATPNHAQGEPTFDFVALRSGSPAEARWTDGQ